MRMTSYEHAKDTERQVCAFLGKKHLGGPGEPDCDGGGQVVEVKDQRRRVNVYQLNEIMEKPWAQKGDLIVASTSGFTDGARELARDSRGVYLYKVYRGPHRSRRRV